MPIEASDREMDSVMLGIESRTIGEEMPKKLEKMLIQRSTVKRKKDFYHFLLLLTILYH